VAKEYKWPRKAKNDNSLAPPDGRGERNSTTVVVQLFSAV